MNTIKNPVRVMKLASKFASKDKSRAALMRVKLDAGSAWSTDSYMLCEQSGVYDGEPVELPASMVKSIAKMSQRGNESATVEVGDDSITVKLSGGATVKGVLEGGKYPETNSLKELMGFEKTTRVLVNAAQAAAAVKLHDKTKIIVDETGIAFERAEGEPKQRTHFDVGVEGRPFEAVYNSRWLAKVIKGVAGTGKSAEVALEFQDWNKPVSVYSHANKVQALMMPITRLSRGSAKPKPKRETTAKAVERKAKEKAGVDMEAAVHDLGGGVTAITLDPVRKPAAKPKPKAEPEPKPEPDVEVATESSAISLAMVERMFADDRKVAVTQKREGCCIWVSGDTKPHRDELKGIGARWSGKKKAWWVKPTE